MLRKVASCFVVLLAFNCLAVAQATRHFTFHYGFTVKQIPAGERVRIWFPAAHSGQYQEVRVLSAKGDLPLKKTRESRFGNEIYFAETSKAKSGDLHFEVVYDVVRREHLTLGLSRPRLQDASLNKKQLQLFLGPDKLVPITGRPAELALQVTEGKDSELAKARAIYDYVFSNMKYDKSGTGWGHGDVLYACNAKKGNCTDFHSLFIAMVRSQGIPARFEIGFPLPDGKNSSEIPGYHCWAEFFNPQNGWIPVDISEAWKHPEKKDYFFGAHDANRIQFTIGRDLKLNPPQAGDPLNYFVYPYVETGGKEYSQVSFDFSFADANASANRASVDMVVK
ncbi:MAG TPA: transglutaminase-like domain-containing protein [Terriglobales bacterium]|nr:transglutaminase-like domain-containing protein [Terriglobales bacterium]